MAGMTPKEIFDVFQSYDADGSGMISRQEFGAALGRIRGEALKDEDLDEMLKSVDADGDGTVSLLEFAAFAGLGDQIEKWKALFQEVDSDGSGLLEEKELVQIMTSSGSPDPEKDVAEFYQKAGKSRGASFTIDEFIALIVFDTPLVRKGVAFSIPPLSEDRMAELESLFIKYDTDGSGTISRKELKKVLVDLWGREPSSKEVKYVLKKVDGNGSKTVAKSEFLVMMGYANEVETFRKVFNEFDQDGNGKLEKEELISMLKKLGTPNASKEARKFMKTSEGKRKKHLNFESFLNILI